jgi:hypothetical protein
MTAELHFHRVPHPVYEDHPIVKAENQGQNNLGTRTVKGVVWHRMIGTLRGTDTYFGFPTTRALTDYGVGVLAQDGPQDDGVIIRWNDPLGIQSGWASGSYSSAAYGDGEAFVEKYGINAINRDQASIEVSGKTYEVPLSPKSRAAICAITAYWADQYEIPWDVWPIAPQDGFSFVRWHNEFGPDNGTKRCPGSVVMAETSALIEQTRAILKAHQTAEITPVPEPIPVPKPPVYVAPKLPEWWDRALEQRTPSDAMVSNTRWYAIRRREEAVRNANRYSQPDTSAPKSGPKIMAGEKINIERFVRAGGRVWFIEDAGHFVTTAAFTPAVNIRGR